ncbi:MAG: DUF4337 family protein [Polyangiaceae bacterium]
MSEATEMLEHMEHAGHGGGHGEKGGPGKQIGITMALLGVMLAFCAAMVGSERTELIKTMVEQSNKYGIYQSETTKLRVIDGNLEILKALTPSKEEAAKLDATLRGKRGSSGKADDEDTAELKDLIASSMDDMADLLAPDNEDVTHFQKLSRRFANDAKEAKEDAEAYEGSVKTHERASELYERAQLLAEIGIVVASVALLMASKKVWAISVISGALGLATVGYTAYTTHEGLAAAEAKIEEAAKREAVMETEDDDEKAGEGKAAEAKPGAAPEKKAEPKDEKKDEKKAEPKDEKKDAPPKK